MTDLEKYSRDNWMKVQRINAYAQIRELMLTKAKQVHTVFLDHRCFTIRNARSTNIEELQLSDKQFNSLYDKTFPVPDAL